MRKSSNGFTVIEMIVVTVIIGVLVSIAYVAYSGAQDRAKNAQTYSAAEQWMKVLQIYKVRHGAFPATPSCLGANYMYNSDNAGTTGIGQCRQTNSTTGIRTENAFYTAVSPYLTGDPTPAMLSAINTTTSWYRGLYYTITGGMGRVEFVIKPSAGDCPDQVGGVARTSTTTLTNGNRLCVYQLGTAVGY